MADDTKMDLFISHSSSGKGETSCNNADTSCCGMVGVSTVITSPSSHSISAVAVGMWSFPTAPPESFRLFIYLELINITVQHNLLLKH